MVGAHLEDGDVSLVCVISLLALREVRSTRLVRPDVGLDVLDVRRKWGLSGIFLKNFLAPDVGQR